MHKSRLCSFPGNFALQGKKGLDSAFESKMNICKRGRMIRFKSFLFLLLKGFLLNKEKKPQSCSARCCTGSLCCKVNTEQAPRLPEGGRRKDKQSGSSLLLSHLLNSSEHWGQGHTRVIPIPTVPFTSVGCRASHRDALGISFPIPTPSQPRKNEAQKSLSITARE